ncbi:TPA: hypothetical protein ACJ569_002936 [Kluyvera cryocrescens]
MTNQFTGLGTDHPANRPLTVDRITRLIAELHRSLEYQNGGDMAYVIADAIKGLEELLERRKAELCNADPDDDRRRRNREANARARANETPEQRAERQRRNRERMRKKRAGGSL